MLEVRPSIPSDFHQITLRGWQDAAGYSLETCARHDVLVQNAWTGRRRDTDEVLAIAGILPRHPGHGTAWAFISADISGREWVAITRAVDDHLREALESNYHRVEAWAHAEPQAWRDVASKWLRRLGFEYEGLARQFTPDRADMLIYSRVR